MSQCQGTYLSSPSNNPTRQGINSSTFVPSQVHVMDFSHSGLLNGATELKRWVQEF